MWSPTLVRSGDERLPPAAGHFFERTAAATDEIALPTISRVEIVYLEERKRGVAGTLALAEQLLNQARAVLVETPVGRRVVRAMTRVPRPRVPDLPDRTIAATALSKKCPAAGGSRDGRIRASGAATIWYMKTATS